MFAPLQIVKQDTESFFYNDKELKLLSRFRFYILLIKHVCQIIGCCCSAAAVATAATVVIAAMKLS